MLTMDERIRITFDVPEDVRRALNIRAARSAMSVGEIIELLVVEGMSDDLEIARRSLAEGKPAPNPKRGRKPKGGDQ